ncbi:hypothetical protein BH11PLA2_BH11PLA2_41200 [soil metagenome]
MRMHFTLVAFAVMTITANAQPLPYPTASDWSGTVQGYTAVKFPRLKFIKAPQPITNQLYRDLLHRPEQPEDHFSHQNRQFHISGTLSSFDFEDDEKLDKDMDRLMKLANVWIYSADDRGFLHSVMLESAATKSWARLKLALSLLDNHTHSSNVGKLIVVLEDIAGKNAAVEEEALRCLRDQLFYQEAWIEAYKAIQNNPTRRAILQKAMPTVFLIKQEEIPPQYTYRAADGTIRANPFRGLDDLTQKQIDQLADDNETNVKKTLAELKKGGSDINKELKAIVISRIRSDAFRIEACE